eukprot:scaffold80989_cov37-Tisochrysis_lutea.AAC.1
MTRGHAMDVDTMDEWGVVTRSRASASPASARGIVSYRQVHNDFEAIVARKVFERHINSARKGSTRSAYARDRSGYLEQRLIHQLLADTHHDVDRGLLNQADEHIAPDLRDADRIGAAAMVSERAGKRLSASKTLSGLSAHSGCHGRRRR